MSDIINGIQSSAGDALGAANSAIGGISSPQLNLDFSGVEIPEISMEVSGNFGSPPSPPSIDLSIGGADFDGSETAVGEVSALEISEFSGEAPAVSAEKPTLSYPTDPGDAPSIRDVNLPDAPVYDLSGIIRKIDALVGADLPTFDPVPEVSVPDFNAVPGNYTVETPGAVFSYTEGPYNSAVVEALTVKLLDTVRNGGTGLGAEIEALIWERAQDRLADAHEAKRRQIEERFTGMGWDVPPGALESALNQADNERMRTLEQTSHEIAIEQARLAQANTQFAIEKSIALENTVMAMTNAIRDRALQAAVAASEDLSRVFGLQVEFARFKMEEYKTEADVYKTQIEAAIAKLDVYRAGLDAQKTMAEIKAVNAELIGKEVDAVLAAAQVYTAQVQGALAEVDVEKARLAAFAEKVNIYNAKWQGITAQIGVYQAELAGDQTRAEIFNTQVNAYNAYLGGKETEIKAQVSQLDAQIKAAQVDIESQRIGLEKYQIEAGVKMSEASAKAQIYASQVQGYAAETGAAASQMNAEAQVAIAQGKNALAAAEIAEKEAEARIQESIQAYGIEVEKAKAIANSSAQLASSLYAALNVGASISDSFGKSYGVSMSHSESLANSAVLSESHVYEE